MRLLLTHSCVCRNGSDSWGGAYAKEARRAVLRLQGEQDQALAALDQHWRETMADKEQQVSNSNRHKKITLVLNVGPYFR